MRPPTRSGLSDGGCQARGLTFWATPVGLGDQLVSGLEVCWYRPPQQKALSAGHPEGSKLRGSAPDSTPSAIRSQPALLAKAARPATIAWRPRSRSISRTSEMSSFTNSGASSRMWRRLLNPEPTSSTASLKCGLTRFSAWRTGS